MSVLPTLNSNRNSQLIISGEIWSAMKEQASIALRSGLLPDAIKTPEQALVIAIKGIEVGMPLMQSFSHINVIKGKPSTSAEGMLYLIFKNCPTAVVNFPELSKDQARITAARSSRHPLTEFIFSMEDAKRAQLLSNPSWQKYPKAMLKARCISDMARTIFPDCIAGVSYTPEELGADVNEEGEIIEMPKEMAGLKKPATPRTEDSQTEKTKESSTPSKTNFDPENPAHSKAMIGILQDKFDITETDLVKSICEKMRGRTSDELVAVIDSVVYGREKENSIDES